MVIIMLRNMCAHGGVLYDLAQPKSIINIPGGEFAFTDNHSLDASIKVIRYLLSQISVNRENDLKIKLQELFLRFGDNEQIKKIIKSKIGYQL